MLGHSTIAITLDTYSHYIKSLHGVIADDMDRHIYGVDPGDAGHSSTASRSNGRDGSGDQLLPLLFLLLLREQLDRSTSAPGSFDA